jgi:hypothetical protein
MQQFEVKGHGHPTKYKQCSMYVIVKECLHLVHHLL